LFGTPVLCRCPPIRLTWLVFRILPVRVSFFSSTMTKITNSILRTSDSSKKPVKSFLLMIKNCWLGPRATSKSVPEYETSDCVYTSFLANFRMGIGFIGHAFGMATVHNFYQDGCKGTLVTAGLGNKIAPPTNVIILPSIYSTIRIII